MVDLTFEQNFWGGALGYVAGIDEAGRGPLAGPVVAAAVMFAPGTWIEGVDDSKKIPSKQREEMFEIICQQALSIGTGIVSHTIIDQVNILQATLQAMAEAVSRLTPLPQHLLVDGRAYGPTSIPATPIIDGDARCFSIAAASIIAKVTRDKLMLEWDKHFPQYGFAKHKGYGTKEHFDAIRRFGPCEIHRRSFQLYHSPVPEPAPVAEQSVP